MKIFSLTTLPDRVLLLERAVASIYQQADRINVFLDGHAARPGFLEDPKIEVASARELGQTWHARLKFYWAADLPSDCYHFTVDDDIVYPPDYADHLVAAIERHGRRAAIGVLGHRFLPAEPGAPGCYYNRRTTYTLRMPIAQDIQVHSVGSGTLAYHSSTITFDMRADMPKKDMEDLFVAISCRRAGVPIYVAHRPPNWLEPLPTPGYSIYGAWKVTGDDREQAAVMARFDPWPTLPAVPRSVHRGIQAFFREDVAKRRPAI